MTMAELSEAFYPGTNGGLVDAWHNLNMRIRELRKERDNIAELLLDKSVKGADMSIEEPWRVGEVLAGKEVAVQAIWRLTEGGSSAKWKPSLEYVRNNDERN